MHVHGFLAYEVTYIGVTFIVPRNISYPGRQLQDCTTTENVEGSEQKVYCKMNVLVYPLILAMHMSYTGFPLGYIVSIGAVVFLVVMLLCYILVCICTLVSSKSYQLLTNKSLLYVYEGESDDENQRFQTQNGINTACEVFDNTCHDKKKEVAFQGSLTVNLPTYDCLRHQSCEQQQKSGYIVVAV